MQTERCGQRQTDRIFLVPAFGAGIDIDLIWAFERANPKTRAGTT